MAGKTYSAADIQVIEFDQHVWANPTMYFGVRRGDPELATQVLCAVLGHALHPATRVAPAHTPQVEAEVHGDLKFWVADDQADALDEQSRALLGYYGSLLGPNRWNSAAAAALSTRTAIEVWRDGYGFRQELAGLRPIEQPQEIGSPTGAGTRVAFELDRAYVGAGTALTDDLGSLDLHGLHCSDPHGPGGVVVRDLRDRSNPAEFHYR
ncbi:hypothetical protein ACFY0P_09395 [Streptomyces sp. NPDC001714]|uniref:hypothetical protein n=1 Tax=Streptomyces sp. NPDC001714 TaxID=3364603 RepID=UPI0036905E62